MPTAPAVAEVGPHEISTMWLGLVLLVTAIMCNNPRRRNKEQLRLDTHSKVEMDKKIAANTIGEGYLVPLYIVL